MDRREKIEKVEKVVREVLMCGWQNMPCNSLEVAREIMAIIEEKETLGPYD